MSERLTFRRFASDWLSQANLENGLLRTFIDLTIRPGQMLVGYLDGTRRSQYVRAVTYLVLAMTIYVWVTAYYNLNMQWIADQTAPPSVADPMDIKFWNMMGSVFGNVQLMIYALLPLQALVTMVVFEFWRRNFIEHLVINCFLAAQTTFLVLPLEIAMRLYEPLQLESTQNIELGITLVYVTWVYFQINEQSRMDARVRNILRSIFGVVAVLMMITIVLLIVTIVMAFWADAQTASM